LGIEFILVVVVAVGMWESASSISKVCGKGGKQHHRFPGFPQTVISTACLDHPEKLRRRSSP
jgi:hypothetical protein